MKLHTTGNYEYDTVDNHRRASQQTVEAATSHPMAEGEVQTSNSSDNQVRSPFPRNPRKNIKDVLI